MRPRILLLSLWLCLTLAVRVHAATEEASEEADKPRDPVKELVEKHLKAVGGKARVEALTAFKATGSISIGQRTIPFTLYAQEPNRVRTEIESEGHKIIQAYDGKNPPWQLNDNTDPAIPVVMTGDAAREFAADAEFYSPLINAENRGLSLKYVGEGKMDDRRCLRLAVFKNGENTMEVHLDPDSFLIVRQVHKRRAGSKREILIETRLGDYRKVAGVMLPHRITVIAQGRKLHEMELEDIRPNPDLPLLLFNQSGQ